MTDVDPIDLDPRNRLNEAVLHPPARNWVQATPGVIARDLMDDAHTRGALAEMASDSFDDTHDSAGAPWTGKVTMSMAPFWTYRHVFDHLADLGVCTYSVTTDPWQLRLVNAP